MTSNTYDKLKNTNNTGGYTNMNEQFDKQKTGCEVETDRLIVLMNDLIGFQVTAVEDIGSGISVKFKSEYDGEVVEIIMDDPYTVYKPVD